MMASGAGPPAPPDVWLQAFHDPVAGLRVFSQSLRLIDLSGDGDFRLLAADLDRKLKVFRGTGVSSVHPLLDQPVAAAVFYPDAAAPRTPAVAVAAGPVVFIYRNLRPYLKFTLPQVPLSAAELDEAAAMGQCVVFYNQEKDQVPPKMRQELKQTWRIDSMGGRLSLGLPRRPVGDKLRLFIDNM